MSKHLGNVLEPIPLMDDHGADALRWYFAASGSPWSTRRVGHATLEEIVRKILLTYWNTVSFLVLYANAAAAQAARVTWTAERVAEAPPAAERPVLDRWLLSELHALVRDVTAAFEGFDSAAAGRRIAGFIDDMSNWYVRRSRRRFWEGPGTPDGAAAFATLYECLETLTRLMAPITPFLPEYVWGVLRAEGSPNSVHLASWPTADPSLIDERLSGQMALARRLVELGRSARAAAVVRVRQPLARALIGAAGFEDLPADLAAQVADELNVRALDALSAVPEGLVDYTVKPNYRALGGRFGKGTPAVARAIEAADAAALAAELRSGGKASVEVDGSRVSLGPDDVIVTQVPRSGLGGGVRRRRDGRARDRHHAGTAPGGARPRGRPAGPGRAQERRPGRERPCLAALEHRRPRAGRRPDRAWDADQRRGAGRRLRPAAGWRHGPRCARARRGRPGPGLLAPPDGRTRRRLLARRLVHSPAPAE